MEKSRNKEQILPPKKEWHIAEHQFIYIILILAFVLRIMVLITSGNRMTLYSDDGGYVQTAVEFIKSGYITYTDRHYSTVFMMPGLPILLNLIFRVTGYTEAGLLAARVPFICLGTLSVWGIYLNAKLISNIKVANIAAFLAAVFVPYISMNNLFMTETPFMAIILFLTYYIFKFCEQPSTKNFLITLTLFLIGILFKPTLGIYPVAFVPYALYKKLPIKMLFKKGLYAALIVIMFMSQWWIRNYIVLGEPVLFTGNQGDTLLLGTFQGVGYPEGSYEEINAQIRENRQGKGPENLYFTFKDRGIAAKQRIKEWIKKDTVGFLYSNLVYKPVTSIRSIYYPKTVFNIPASFAAKNYRWILFFTFFGLLYTVYKWKNKKQVFMVLCLLIGLFIMVLLQAFYFAYSRYTLPWTVLIFILSAMGIYGVGRFIFLVCKNLIGDARSDK